MSGIILDSFIETIKYFSFVIEAVLLFFLLKKIFIKKEKILEIISLIKKYKIEMKNKLRKNNFNIPKEEEEIYIKQKLLKNDKLHLPIEKVLYLIRNWKEHNFFASEDGKIIVQLLDEKMKGIEQDEEQRNISLSKKREHSLAFQTYSVSEREDGGLELQQDNGTIIFNKEGNIERTITKADIKKEANQNKSVEQKEATEILNEQCDLSENDDKKTKTQIEQVGESDIFEKKIIDAKSLAKSLARKESQKKTNQDGKYFFGDIGSFFTSEFCQKDNNYEKEVERFFKDIFQLQGVYFSQEDGKVYIGINSFLITLSKTITNDSRENFLYTIFDKQSGLLKINTVNILLERLYQKIKVVLKSEIFVFFKNQDNKSFLLSKGVKDIENDKKFSQDFIVFKIPQNMQVLHNEKLKLRKIIVIAKNIKEVNSMYFQEKKEIITLHKIKSKI